MTRRRIDRRMSPNPDRGHAAGKRRVEEPRRVDHIQSKRRGDVIDRVAVPPIAIQRSAV